METTTPAEVRIHPEWKSLLADEFGKPYFHQLTAFVRAEFSQATCYPPASKIFNAFDRCPPSKLKVVIIGQDPYHGPGQANGLCFSVGEGVRKPPSLVNIFKEINSDLGKSIPETGNLESWADQGVLLLNAILTVRKGQPGSHQKCGWQDFTSAVIEKLNNRHNQLVFLLWGAFAQKKGAIIDSSRHLVLQSAHPSPFSADRGFFGNKHFSKTNDYLKSIGKTPIDW